MLYQKREFILCSLKQSRFRPSYVWVWCSAVVYVFCASSLFETKKKKRPSRSEKWQYIQAHGLDRVEGCSGVRGFVGLFVCLAEAFAALEAIGRC